MNRSSSKSMESSRATHARSFDGRVRFASVLCLAFATTVGCNDDFGGNPNPDVGGTAGSDQGGASASTGGTRAKGGSATDEGGTSATVVSAAKGGSGGEDSGTGGTGGSSVDATGGVSASGGTVAKGGSTAAGGTVGTGGSTAAGGTVAKGGSTAAGGVPSSGGTVGTGGTTVVIPPAPAATAILKYDFDTVGDSKATDSSGNTIPNDGSLTNVTVADVGRNTGRADFSETSSQIAMPKTMLSAAKSLSASAWVKLTSNEAGSRLFTFTNGSSAYLYLALNDSPAAPPSGTGGASGVGGAGGLGGTVGAGGTTSTSTVPAAIRLVFKSPAGEEQVLTTQTKLPPNVWKHVTVTMWSYGAAMYVDGKVVAQNNSLAMDPSAMGPISDALVGNSETGTLPIQGQVDEFHLYEGLLTQSEIYALAAPQTDYSMFHFDEGSGTTVADSSGRAKNGTLTGATWTTGAFGSALKFDNPGTAPAVQYATLPDGMIEGCTTTLTLATWINIETNDLAHGDAPILQFAQDEFHYIDFTTYAGGTKNQPTFSFGVQDGKGVWRTQRKIPYSLWTLGQWSHTAIVRDGTSVYLYRDGVSLGTWDYKSSAAFWSTTTKNYLGKSQLDTLAGWDGSIDELLISCRAYTADEIKQLAYRP